MNGKPANWHFGAGACGLALLLAVELGPTRAAAQAAGDSTIKLSPKLNLQEAPLKPEIKAATSLGPVIKKIAPSVVNIYSTATVREPAVRNPLFDDPFFRRFFGDRFGEQSQPREHKTQSLGSGIIVTSDGYILTANHGIEGA